SRSPGGSARSATSSTRCSPTGPTRSRGPSRTCSPSCAASAAPTSIPPWSTPSWASSATSTRRCWRLAQRPSEPVGQRLEQQLFAREEDEVGARLVDELDRAPQAVDVRARRVLAQRVEAIDGVHDLGCAVGDGGDVAEPQAG